ncbi:MAG: hypothetical protein AAFY41_13505, partial [Bacteroidota bacterium]
IIKDLKDQRDDWKNQYEKAANQFEDEILKLNRYIDEIEGLTARLKKQVDELTKENKELKKKIKAS